MTNETRRAGSKSDERDSFHPNRAAPPSHERNGHPTTTVDVQNHPVVGYKHKEQRRTSPAERSDQSVGSHTSSMSGLTHLLGPPITQAQRPDSV